MIVFVRVVAYVIARIVGLALRALLEWLRTTGCIVGACCAARRLRATVTREFIYVWAAH